jgi:thioredoxin-related protein
MKLFLYMSSGVLGLLVVAIITLSIMEPNVTVFSESEMRTSLNNKETFVMVLGSSTCDACVDYKKSVLPQYLKGDFDIPLKFSYSDHSFATWNNFIQFTKDYEIPYDSSPTTYMVKNGVITAQVRGYITISQLNQFIETNQ